MTLNEALNSEEIAKKVEAVSSMDEAVGILKGYGVETTAEELAAMIPEEDGELADDNLENVSGGCTWIAGVPLLIYALWKMKKGRHSGGGGGGGGGRGF